MLIPLDVVEERTLHADGDAIATIRAEGYGVSRKTPAVHITTDPDGHVRHLLGDEVIAGVEVQRPILGGLDAPENIRLCMSP